MSYSGDRLNRLEACVKRYLKDAVKSMLRVAGLEISRLGPQVAIADIPRPFLARKYMDVVRELHDCYREIVFPGIPLREGRIELMARLVGTQASEAMYILEFLHRSLSLSGDICEFGVAQGATSAFLANEIRESDKNLWLFDSFRGLPKPSAKDSLLDDIFNLGAIGEYEGTMSYGVREVESRLMAISYPPSRARIVKGLIEETVNHPGLPNAVCFAYVDFDFYSPVLTALDFLHGRLSVGGSVMVDDYGFFSAGAQAAVDEFVGRHRGDYDVIFPRAFSGHFIVLRKTA